MIKTPKLWAQVLSIPLFLTINSLAAATFSPADLQFSLIPSDQTEVQTSVLTNGSAVPISYSVRSTSIVNRPVVTSTITNFAQSTPVPQAMLTHQAQNSTNFVPGEVIVAIQEPLGVSSFSALSTYPVAFDGLSIDHIKTIVPPQVKNEVISLLSSTQQKILVLTLSEETIEAVTEAVASLNNDPEILYAEPNWIISAQGIPNDTDFSNQWGLNNTGQTGGIADSDIDMPEAWDYTTGERTTVVAIIDSGIDYDHPELADNLWTNPNEIPNNGIDDDLNGYIDDVHGWNFIDDTNDARDDYNHGSNVAGIIAAKGDNNDGITGIAWNTQLVSLKFLDATGNGNSIGALQAIYYAINNNIPIINNSWGGTSYSQMLKDAIDGSDALFICAAGNSGQNSDDNPVYPAAYTSDNIISVGSSTHLDWIANHSNYGAISVDLMAPGESIYTTSRNDAYQNAHGTSVAAPFVSGVAALIYSLNPSITAVQMKNLILDNTDPVGHFFGKSVTGGRLNALNAVSKATPTWFTVTDNGNGTIIPGGSVEFTVSVDPSTLEAGIWEVEIEVETSDPASPVVTLPVTLNIGTCGTLTTVPSTLTFPLTWIGNTATESIELHNTCNSDVSIHSITSTLGEVMPNLSAPLTVPAFGSLTLPATFSPIAAGIQVGQLIIESQATPSTLTIDVQTNADNGPILTFSNPDITENLIEGEARVVPFIVTNTGQQPLEFTLIASEAWIIVPTSLYTVAPGASTTINITLDAGTLNGGTYSSDIEFLHNGVGTSPLPLPTTIVIEADNFAYVTPSVIDFGDISGPVNETFTPEPSVGALSHSGSYTVGDLDNDGDPDYVLGSMVNASPVTSNLVWLNNADVCNTPFNHQIIAQGTIAQEQYDALEMGDLDGDGDMDLVASVSIAGSTSELLWFENNGSQSFTRHSIVQGLFAKEISILDFDSDGAMDIILTDITSNSIVLLTNSGNEIFSLNLLISLMHSTIHTIKHLDINNDGQMDFAGIIYNTNTSLFEFVSYLNTGYLNNISASYDYTVYESFSGTAPTISVGHINGDNLPDVVLVGEFDHIKGYTSLAGSFTPFTVPHAGLSGQVIISDLNNDGETDLLSVVNDLVTGPTLSILYKSGSTYLAPVPIYTGTMAHMVALDFNRDADIDIAAYDTDNNEMILVHSNRSITREVAIENTGGYQTEIFGIGIDAPFEIDANQQSIIPRLTIIPAHTKLCFDIAHTGNNDYVTGGIRFQTNALNGQEQTASFIAGVSPYADIAPGKRVSASSEEGQHYSNFVNDLNGNTRWSSDFTNNQSITIDLLGSYDINQVQFNWEAASGKHYQIQVKYAGDNSTWHIAKEEFNGDGGWDSHNVNLSNVTQVKMQGITRNTEYGYSLWAFKIWGTGNNSSTPMLTYIDVTPTISTIRANETAQFTAEGLDQNRDPFAAPITWSVSGSATITQNGLVTPSTRGYYVVTARSGSVTQTAELFVAESPALDHIVVSPSNQIIMEGETVQYSAIGYDQFGNTLPIAPLWSADGGSIDAAALYSGSTPGAFTITATVNSIIATASVTVNAAPEIAIIIIAPLNATIMEGATLQYSATGIDQYGDAIAVNPTWTTTGGSIDAAALYTGSVPGAFTVTATENGITASVPITINDAPRLDIINITPLNETIMEGATLLYSATGIDQYGDAIAVNPTWTTTGGSIDAAALYTGSTPGVFTVTATESGVIATTSITINDAPRVDVINISPLDETIMEGATLQYSVIGIDQYGNPIALNPTWTSTGGSIDATGLYTGSTPGVFTVTATENGVTASTPITINDAPAVSILTITPLNETIMEGATLQYSATGIDQYGNPIAVNPTWTTDGGSINAAGLYTGSAPGAFTVTGTENGVITSTSITINDAPRLDRIVVSPLNDIIMEGTTLQYSAVGFDQYGTAMGAISPTWTTNGGTISTTGLYTGSLAGAYIVTANLSGITASTGITVTDAPMLVRIELAPINQTIGEGTTLQYSAVGYDQFGNLIAFTPVWSTDGGSIASSGLYTASVDGAFTVTATSNGVSESTSITVTAAPTLASITVTPDNRTVTVGGNQQYAATGTDQYGNSIAIPSLTWSVLGSAGTINQSGRFTATAASNASRIVASSGSVTGYVSVTTVALPSDVALHKPASASTNESGHSASEANDGNDISRWSSAFQNNQYLQINLQGLFNITTSKIKWETAAARSYRIEVSENGSNWTTAYSTAYGNGGTDNHTLNREKVGYIRMYGVTRTTEWGFSIHTFEVMGTPYVNDPPVLTSIQVTPATSDVKIGETQQFTATAFDQFNDPYLAIIDWNAASGSISTTGLYTPSTEGPTTVTASAEGISESVTVTVLAAPQITSIVVNPTATTIDQYQTEQFNAEAFDQYGESIIAVIDWSTTLGTIDASGTYTSSIPGTGIVTATSGTITTDADVTVIELPILSSALVTPTVASIDFEGTQQLHVQGFDQFGNPINAAFTWSATIGTIGLDGYYYGSTAGIATITASAPNSPVSATATITVADAPVLTTAVVSPNGVSLPFGASEQFFVEGFDQYGNPINASFTWSTSIGTITATGLFVGTQEGIATITATSGAVTASVTATVAEQPVLTSAVVTPDNSAIPYGGTIQFAVEGFDQFGNSIPAAYTWSTSIGSISPVGLFTGSQGGIATITATSGSVTTSVTATVAAQPVITSAVITPGNTTIPFGGTVQFMVQGYDQFGNTIPENFTWSADIGSISTSGLYSGSAEGSATISATAGAVTATVTVIVSAQPTLSTIVVTPDVVTMAFGGTQQFTVEGFDQFGNLIPATYTWSADIGTITPAGLYSGSVEGSATITATSGTITGTASVTVSAQPVLTIAVITPSTVTLAFGDDVQFTVEGFDQFGNPIPATYTWAASKGTIDNNGFFTGSEEGVATITASSSGVVAIATATVSEEPVVTTITLTPTTATLSIGQDLQFNATATDQFGDPIATTFRWGVVGTAGTIDINGLFSAISASSGTIISVSSASVVTTANVVIYDNPILTSITLTPVVVTLDIGDQQLYTAIGYDQFGDVIAAPFTWSIIGSGGTINTSGRFVATAASQNTKVMVTSGSVTAQATVRVNAVPVDVALNKSATASSTESGYPARYANDGNSTSRWSSSFSDPQWLEIDLNGQFDLSSVRLKWETAAAAQYQILVSADKSTWRVAYTVTNGNGGNDNFSINEQDVRYVRMRGTKRTTQWGYSLFNFEVYGVDHISDPPYLVAMDLTPKNVSIVAGQTQLYLATGLDQYGDNYDVTPTWSVNGSATIVNGTLSATDAGIYTVTATQGTGANLVEATTFITVTEAPRLAEIAVTPSNPTIMAGETQQFSVRGIDQFGDAFPVNPTWSTGTGATINNGLFTSNIGGTYIVEAIDGAITGSTSITVLAAPALNTIMVTPNNQIIMVGESLQFSATGEDQYGDPIATNPIWSTASGAAVNGGLFIPSQAGIYVVTATDGSVSNFASIEVLAAPALHSIDVTPNNQIIMVGESLQFSATGEDQYGNTFPVAATWSTTSGAVVNTGLFIPSQAGIYVVTATDGSVSNFASIEVLAAPALHSIDVTPNNQIIMVGESLQFSAAGEDQYGNTFPITAAWSTNSGAVVNGGLFIPSQAGIYTVTAADGSVSGFATIEVTAAPALHSIDVTPNNQIIKVGESLQFSAAGEDQYGNTFPVAATWSTNSGAVVNGGLFIPSQAGIFTVTAADGSVSGLATIEVLAAPTLFEITITPQNSFINANETQQFSVTGIDQYGNGYPVVPTWETSTDASITTNGLFTSAIASVYVVRATDGAVTATTNITVIELPRVDIVTVDHKEVEQGQSIALTYSAVDQFGNAITPASVTYAVNGGGTVSGNTFTATAAGTWNITVTADGVVGTNTVTVTNLPSMVKNGDFSNGKNDWKFSLYGGYATWSINNGRTYFDISNGGSADWNIQFEQQGFNLKQGKSYIFRFDAKATGSRTISAQVEKSTNPWTNYGSIPKTSLTTTMTTYEYPFVMPANDANARIVFNVGTYGNDITLDNIELIELP